MNHNTLSTPTRANSSDALERGLLQWFLVQRRATATTGADPTVARRNANVAA